jgi:hypothetical protein
LHFSQITFSDRAGSGFHNPRAQKNWPPGKILTLSTKFASNSHLVAARSLTETRIRSFMFALGREGQHDNFRSVSSVRCSGTGRVAQVG